MQKPIETIPQGVRHIHCIGIGGSGMFPLVQILHGRGYTITGSDNNESDIVELERQMGIEVTMGQRAENIRGADLILYSAAIMETNPELIAARESGLPLWERAKMLGAVSSWYSEALGVCGTHGKTTTTAMIVQILYMAGLDPSAVIGGKLRTIGGYGRSGATQRFVYEACEFKDTFLSTHPDIALVLNIDNDHMEYFHTVENAMKSYTEFAEKAHTVLYNGSDEKTCRAMAAAAGEGRSFLTFGWEENNDYYPADIRHLGGLDRRFTLMFRGKPLTELHLQIPGDHNILNAVAAAAGAMQLGATPEQAAAGLSAFTGAGRRFEVLGKTHTGATVADDYAHHPAELRATLTAAKELDFKRVWAVFQPFTFSRTYMLLDDFVSALSIADCVVLSPIMGSREVNTYHITSEDLGEKIPGSVCLPSFRAMADYVSENAEAGDLILTLGCGDIYKCARMILHHE